MGNRQILLRFGFLLLRRKKVFCSWERDGGGRYVSFDFGTQPSQGRPRGSDIEIRVSRRFPFFASALILPRTDHFKLLVCISVRGSWSISFHFFPFQVTYCSSRWFAILGPFPAATIDFSHPFPTYLESVPPRKSYLFQKLSGGNAFEVSRKKGVKNR